MTSQNHYQFLGVTQDATLEEIKSAYRRLALKHHPDRNKDKKTSEQKMKEINFIYSILSDSRKRRSYDETLGEKDYFDDLFNRSKKNRDWVNIYCEELEVLDITGEKSKIKVGESIYCAVEVDTSILGFKYKRKEYFDVYIKNIFNPDQSDHFAEALGIDIKKEPLCQAHFGNEDLIIYKEDFQSYWLTEEHYNKIDLKKGLTTALLVLLTLAGGVYWLFVTHPLSAEQKEELELTQTFAGIHISSRRKLLLQQKYDATDGEINYIVTEQYQTCKKKEVKTNSTSEIRNAPDTYALVKGSIKKDTDVEILLYYEGHRAYKIKTKEFSGWVPEKVLDSPECVDDSE